MSTQIDYYHNQSRTHNHKHSFTALQFTHKINRYSADLWDAVSVLATFSTRVLSTQSHTQSHTLATHFVSSCLKHVAAYTLRTAYRPLSPSEIPSQTDPFHQFIDELI